MKKEFLIEMYNKKKHSMFEISKIVNCSVNKVNYWMRRHQIKTRDRSAAMYEKMNPNGDPFKLKKLKTNNDFLLLGLGLGLWWGEGSKTHPGVIRLGNSDPRLICKFISFLCTVFGIKKEKLKFGLQVFSDQNPVEVKNKWLKVLNLPESSFLPTVVVTKKRGSGSYRILNKWGVVTLYFSNIKLKKIFDSYMSKYAMNE